MQNIASCNFITLLKRNKRMSVDIVHLNTCLSILTFCAKDEGRNCFCFLHLKKEQLALDIKDKGVFSLSIFEAWKFDIYTNILSTNASIRTITWSNLPRVGDIIFKCETKKLHCLVKTQLLKSNILNFLLLAMMTIPTVDYKKLTKHECFSQSYKMFSSQIF